jgi:hypothetical protein
MGVLWSYILLIDLTLTDPNSSSGDGSIIDRDCGDYGRDW